MTRFLDAHIDDNQHIILEESAKTALRPGAKCWVLLVEDDGRGLHSAIGQKPESISYGRQHIDIEDLEAVVKTLGSGFLTQGPKIAEFEKCICEYTGAKYCVALANGTAALHLAVLALDCGPGVEGITSPLTFTASANCMAYCGMKPVFADINPRSYNIDPTEIRKKISDRTRLLVPVHFAGQPCAMEEIKMLAGEKGLSVIEDAAHAIGSRYRDGGFVGNCRYSDMTIFSFHPVKTITTGEGGAITTNSKVLYEKLRLLRTHGITRDTARLTQNPGPWYYEMHELGYNYRLTDVQAALGITQMAKLEGFVRRRRDIVQRYNRAFSGIGSLVTPFEDPALSSAFHLYVLQIDFEKIGKSRTRVMEELRKNNIGSQVHYIPVHTQPFYGKIYGYRRGDYPAAEAFYEKALSIPLFPDLSDAEVDHIINTLIGIVS